MTENDIQKKKENLKNVKEVVNESEKRLSVKFRKQKVLKKMQKVKLNLNIKEFRRSELLEKYIVKILFEQDIGKELAKIEVSFSRGETLKRR